MSKTFVTPFYGIVDVLKLHGYMVASWGGDLDEGEYMFRYILPISKGLDFLVKKKTNLVALLRTEAAIRPAMWYSKWPYG